MKTETLHQVVFIDNHEEIYSLTPVEKNLPEADLNKAKVKMQNVAIDWASKGNGQRYTVVGSDMCFINLYEKGVGVGRLTVHSLPCVDMEKE